MSFNFVPATDNTNGLGTSVKRWSWVYVKNGLSDGTHAIRYNTDHWEYTNDGSIYHPLGSFETPDHNDLSAIQGGTSGEYFHLTQAEHDTLKVYENLSVTSGSSWVTVGSLPTVNASIVTLRAQFSGRDSSGAIGSFAVDVAVRRDTGVATVAIVNFVKQIFARDDVAWDVQISANTSTGNIDFQVKQDSANVSHWKVTAFVTSTTF